MGIIKKILGAVLGLFGVLAGLIGIGKKDKYFLDLSEGASPAATPAPAAIEAKDSKNAAKSADKAAAVAGKAVAAAAAVAIAATEAVAAAPAPEPLSFGEIAMIPTSTMSRRRPGPSLTQYKDMAKDMTVRR